MVKLAGKIVVRRNPRKVEALHRLQDERRRLLGRMAKVDQEISKLSRGKRLAPSVDRLDQLIQKISNGLDHLRPLPADFSRAGSLLRPRLMRYLLDTGILARLVHRSDPLHQPIRDALRKLTLEKHAFVATTQNVAEFWSVCTRPSNARGGFGLSIEDTWARLRLLERFVTILAEPDSAYKKWKTLVVNHRVAGRQVHDARLAASMSAYRLRRILTLNPSDFVRFKGLEPLTPNDVLAG